MPRKAVSMMIADSHHGPLFSSQIRDYLKKKKYLCGLVILRQKKAGNAGTIVR
jgi:hypothetical protein